jgi:HPt (histidine-containing phosphotransfer) domain-containing protein
MVFKDLAANLGLDEEDFQELVELFVTTTLSDIEKIKDGVLHNNSKDAAAASHSIKGASGNLGFDEIFTLVKSMENKAKEDNLDDFEKCIIDLENMVNELDKM